MIVFLSNSVELYHHDKFFQGTRNVSACTLIGNAQALHNTSVLKKSACTIVVISYYSVINNLHIEAMQILAYLGPCLLKKSGDKANWPSWHTRMIQKMCIASSHPQLFSVQ